MYTWGDNDEGQLGDGTTNAIQRPRLVAALQGKKINRVACGSAHTLAWSTSKPTNAGKLPAQVLHSLKVETEVKKIRFQLPVDGIKVVQIKIYLKKKNESQIQPDERVLCFRFPWSTTTCRRSRSWP